VNGTEQKRGRFPNHSSEIQTAAASWVVERQTSPDWDKDNQAALDAWLSQSILHRVAFVRFDDAWQRSRRLAALRRSSHGRTAILTLKKMPPFLIRITSLAVCLAILGAGAVLLRPAPVAQLFSTPIGGHEIAVLGDGSRIELNTDTVLRIYDTSDKRTVWLDRGEALFQIKHDATRALIVYAGNHRVTDLGTEFVIRRDGKQVKIALLQGRVSVGQIHRDGRDAVLEPGNVLLASGEQISISKVSQRTLESDLSWRRGLLAFNRASLKDAALEFNRYNREQLTIADPAVGRLVFDGSLPANKPEELAQIAHSFFGLNFKRTDGKIVIYRSYASAK
jgi:transmembrane sensor